MTLGSRVNPSAAPELWGRARSYLTHRELEPDRAWLRQLDRLGRFVGGRFQRMALMFGQKSSAGAAASLRGVSRKPHVVVCENRKNERL